MIDYRFQGRLTYINGGGLNVQMSAWPAAGGGTSPGTTGLLAWWSLDETSGTREDSHTGNYDMSVQGTPSYTTGKKSNAGTVAVTNGAGSYFYYTDSGNVMRCAAGSSISVAGWVYLNSMPSNTAFPVSRWAGTGDWAIGFDANGAVNFSANPGVASVPASTATTGTWYFVVGTYDHTAGTYGTSYVSINNGTVYSTALSSAKLSASGTNVAIGDLGHTATAYGNMSGAVDEVCVYGRVLTADEIEWLYNSGNGRAYSEL